MLLFLLAAGLTLVFGIMNFVNLAHGSLYMMGAYFAAAVFGWTGSFRARGVLAVAATLLLGIVVERVALRTLWARSSLPGARDVRTDPVLQRAGPHHLGPGAGLALRCRPADGPVRSVRLALSVLSLRDHRRRPAGRRRPVWLVHRTRVGMLIRAGASHPEMVGALGINIKRSTRWCSGSAPRWPGSPA